MYILYASPAAFTVLFTTLKDALLAEIPAGTLYLSKNCSGETQVMSAYRKLCCISISHENITLIAFVLETTVIKEIYEMRYG